MPSNYRKDLRQIASNRTPRKFNRPVDKNGKLLKVSDFYGENVFDFTKTQGLSSKVKRELLSYAKKGDLIPKEYVELVAEAAREWAIEKGATHFCHWFQPLTGNSAEKHDAFLTINNKNEPLERLSASQLIQGEPDASSFPHGGSRATFEARGYTIWDLTSPMFLTETDSGSTLCIPTAFVSYTGEALDIKTPLLRGQNFISREVTKFLNLLGDKDVFEVNTSCGAEQEYFLIDKAFYYERPDLMMTGRTLVGKLTAKNQQLSDHYFGSVPQRVLSFMQELDQELYRLGIPSKTRHNEVAPGQFEIAPVFLNSNLSSDQNQIIMAVLKNIAFKHDLIALLHEKPFFKVNGSGKHLNWSMTDNLGRNLLDPGDKPQLNHRFLAICSIIVEAINRHADILRASVATHGNDHRLGGHEAPPSIMSVFLGDTLTLIYDSLLKGESFRPLDNRELNLGTNQLATLLKDNTDRNRTSPFAFTGNRFEFRSVGSGQQIGLPLSLLNAAVGDVFVETNKWIEKEIIDKKSEDEILLEIIKKNMTRAKRIVFNGDGYGQEWLNEAKKRGLSNFASAADSYKLFKDESSIKFLKDYKIFSQQELVGRFNILNERYITHRIIEFETLNSLIDQHIIPATIKYKKYLLKVIKMENRDDSLETKILANLNELTISLYKDNEFLKELLFKLDINDENASMEVAHEILPIANKIADNSQAIENLLPDAFWPLPKYLDMLFVR